MISKMDTLKNKISKMKEQNIIINEETFINLVQKSNTIINPVIKKEKVVLVEDVKLVFNTKNYFFQTYTISV